MKFPERRLNCCLPFFFRLKESAQVGLGTFLFCAVSIIGFAIVSWIVTIAIDPQHLMARHALQIASYTRIPWAIDAGLALFFAAMNWNATRSAATPTDIAFYRRLKEIQNQSEIDRKREVS